MAILAFVLAGCGTQGGQGDAAKDHASTTGNISETYKGSGPIKVTTTIGMITDIVQNVGGDRVEATGLMGAGVDPHLYKATPSDVGKLQNADIIFHNGLHLEGKMGDVLERIGERKPVVAVAKSIPDTKLRRPPEFKGNPDPHIWFDVAMWMLAVETVRDALSQFDPTHSAEYKERAAAYLPKLKELDTYARTRIASVPKSRRVLVTAHDAFSYFGRAYDIEVQGLQGISTASEFGLKDVQRIVNLISSRGIKAVFIESSVPRRSIDAVVQGCAAKGHTVKVGGQLFSDAMGEAGTPAGTYIGMVRHNVDIITDSLK